MNAPISVGEVRLAFRLIVKQPILSVTIILALATGICLSTMGFTLRDEIVNARLPYAAGGRFGMIGVRSRISPRHGDDQGQVNTSGMPLSWRNASKAK